MKPTGRGHLWPPAPGEGFAALDALVLRGLLALVIWGMLGHWSPSDATRIGLTALALWGLQVLLWAGLGRRPALRHVLPAAANTLFWILLVARTGFGQSPFVVGFFLELATCLLRLSVPACGTVTVAGALALGFCAVRDPSPRGAQVAATGAACVLFTGAALVFILRKLRSVDDLGAEPRRTAYVAHGLKNSLHGIGGFADLLASDLPPGDPRHALTQRIQSGLEEAKARLGELMAPPEESRTGAVADLRLAAGRALDSCRGLLEGCGVRADLEVPVGLRAGIAPEALSMALVNLVQNAVQAMRPQGGRVRIEARSDPLRLVVRDTGPGIPEAIRERIFDAHFSTRADGHGLGLAQVRELLRRSGGDVRAGTAPGGGAEIELLLPPPGSVLVSP